MRVLGIIAICFAGGFFVAAFLQAWSDSKDEKPTEVSRDDTVCSSD